MSEAVNLALPVGVLPLQILRSRLCVSGFKIAIALFFPS
jgi:hypothetical protein